MTDTVRTRAEYIAEVEALLTNGGHNTAQDVRTLLRDLLASITLTADGNEFAEFIAIGTDTYATGVLNFTGRVEVGDQVIFAYNTYTAVAAVDFNAPFQFPLGTSIATDAAAFAAAINGTDGINTPDVLASAVPRPTSIAFTARIYRYYVSHQQLGQTTYNNIGAGTNAFVHTALYGGKALPDEGNIRMLVDEYVTVADENGARTRLIGFDSEQGIPLFDPDANSVLFGAAVIASDFRLNDNGTWRTFVSYQSGVVFTIGLGMDVNGFVKQFWLANNKPMIFVDSTGNDLREVFKLDASDIFRMNLKGLPDSDSGLVEGDVWRDPAANNVLKVVPPA